MAMAAHGEKHADGSGGTSATRQHQDLRSQLPPSATDDAAAPHAATTGAWQASLTDSSGLNGLNGGAAAGQAMLAAQPCTADQPLVATEAALPLAGMPAAVSGSRYHTAMSSLSWQQAHHNRALTQDAQASDQQHFLSEAAATDKQPAAGLITEDMEQFTHSQTSFGVAQTVVLDQQPGQVSVTASSMPEADLSSSFTHQQLPHTSPQAGASTPSKGLSNPAESADQQPECAATEEAAANGLQHAGASNSKPEADADESEQFDRDQPSSQGPHAMVADLQQSQETAPEVTSSEEAAEGARLQLNREEPEAVLDILGKWPPASRSARDCHAHDGDEPSNSVSNADKQPEEVSLEEAAAVPLPIGPSASAGDESDKADCSYVGKVHQKQYMRLKGASFAEKHAALAEAISTLLPLLGQKPLRQLQQQLCTPTIVALGPPQSGKSSLLESLSKCSVFPHDPSLGTLAPVKLTTSACADDTLAQYEVTFKGRTSSLAKLDEVRPCVTSILESLTELSQPLTSEEVHVVVLEPGLHCMNLVDLPSVEPGTSAQHKAARTIAESYLKQPETIALCVSSAIARRNDHRSQVSCGVRKLATPSGDVWELTSGASAKALKAMAKGQRKHDHRKTEWQVLMERVTSQCPSLSVITMADLATDGLLQPHLFGNPSRQDMPSKCLLPQPPSKVPSQPGKEIEATAASNCSEGKTSSMQSSCGSPSTSAGVNVELSASELPLSVPQSALKQGTSREKPARLAVINGTHAASDTQGDFDDSEELESRFFCAMLDAPSFGPEDSKGDWKPEQLHVPLERSANQQQKLHLRHSFGSCVGIANVRQQIAHAEAIAGSAVHKALEQKLDALHVQAGRVPERLRTDPSSIHIPTLLMNVSRSINYEAIFNSVMQCPIPAWCPPAVPMSLVAHYQLRNQTALGKHPQLGQLFAPP